MSYSLVRESLHIVENGEDVNKDKKRRRKKPHGVLNLIPAHQRILQKARTSKIISQKKTQAEEIRRVTENPNTSINDNVQRLLALSKQKKFDKQTAEKLFNRAVKKHPDVKEEPKKEEPTAFTEEDFKKFEEEYIGQ